MKDRRNRMSKAPMPSVEGGPGTDSSKQSRGRGGVGDVIQITMTTAMEQDLAREFVHYLEANIIHKKQAVIVK